MIVTKSQQDTLKVESRNQGDFIRQNHVDNSYRVGIPGFACLFVFVFQFVWTKIFSYSIFKSKRSVKKMKTAQEHMDDLGSEQMIKSKDLCLINRKRLLCIYHINKIVLLKYVSL